MRDKKFEQKLLKDTETEIYDFILAYIILSIFCIPAIIIQAMF